MNVNEIVQYIFDSARKRKVGNIKIVSINDRLREGSLAVFRSRYGIPQQYQPGRPIPNMSFQLTTKIKDDLAPFTVHDFPINLFNGYFPYPSDYVHEIGAKTMAYVNPDTIGAVGTTNVVPVDIIDHDKEAYRLTSSIIKSPYLLINNNGFVLGKSTAQVILLSYLRYPITPYWDYDIINGQPVYVANGGTITNNPVYNYQTLSLPRTSQSMDSDFPYELDIEIAKFVLQAIGGETRDDKLYAESKTELITGQ